MHSQVARILLVMCGPIGSQEMYSLLRSTIHPSFPLFSCFDTLDTVHHRLIADPFSIPEDQPTMLAQLATSSRCAALSTLPRAQSLVAIRQASSSSSSGHKKGDEPVAVSTPTEDHSRSPMSQRPLPPDDGKVRK